MPVKVIDRQAQAETEVSSAEAQKGYLQRRYAMPEGQVRVGKGFKTGTVDASQLQASLANGWRVIDEAEAEDLHLKADASSAMGQYIGLHEAALSGASFGLSSYLLERSGLTDARAMKARREQLGSLGTAAEVGGGIVTTLFTGGAGGAVGGAARGGTALARAGAGLARIQQASRAGRLLVPTAKGVAEGFISGAGAALDEAVLGEREITAESLLGGGVSGALFGGAVGGGGALLGGAAGKALRAGQRGSKASLGALQKVWGRATGVPGGKASSEVAQALAKGSDASLDRAVRGYAKLVSGDPEAFVRTARRLKTKDGRARILGDLDSARATSAKQIKAAVDEANTAVDDAIKLTQGQNKLRRVDELMEGVDGAIAPQRAMAHLDEQIGQVQQRLADEALLTPSLTQDLRRVNRMAELAKEKVIRAKSGGEAFKAIDNFKRELDNLAQGRAKQYARSAAPEIQESAMALRGLAKSSRKHLEADEIYGGAAVMQRELNAAASAELSALSELGKKSPQLRKMLERGSEADVATALGLARRYTRVGGATKQSALDAALDARMNYLRTVRKHHDLPAEAAKRIDDAEAAIGKMRSQLEDQSKTAAALDDLWKLREAEGGKSASITAMSTLGPSIGSAIGMSAFGVPGAALGSLAGSAARPYTAARFLASALDFKDKFQGGFRGSLSGIRGRLKGKAAKIKLPKIRAPRGARTSITMPGGFQAGQGRSRQEQALQIRDRAAELAVNPTAASEMLKGQMGNLNEYAPGVADAVSALSQRAAAHLSTKVPTTVEPLFTGGEPLVDPVEMDRFMRHAEAVMDPVGTMGRLEAGTLTPEHVESLEAVYPQTLNAVRSEVVDELLEAQQAGIRVSFQDRNRLGVLLGVPTDASMQPQALAMLQAGFAGEVAQEEAETAPQQRTRASAKFGAGDRAGTDLERLSAGRDQ